jgi:hypothetical protein
MGRLAGVTAQWPPRFARPADLTALARRNGSTSTEHCRVHRSGGRPKRSRHVRMPVWGRSSALETDARARVQLNNLVA